MKTVADSETRSSSNTAHDSSTPIAEPDAIKVTYAHTATLEVQGQTVTINVDSNGLGNKVVDMTKDLWKAMTGKGYEVRLADVVDIARDMVAKFEGGA